MELSGHNPAVNQGTSICISESNAILLSHSLEPDMGPKIEEFTLALLLAMFLLREQTVHKAKGMEWVGADGITLPPLLDHVVVQKDPEFFPQGTLGLLPAHVPLCQPSLSCQPSYYVFWGQRGQWGAVCRGYSGWLSLNRRTELPKCAYTGLLQDSGEQPAATTSPYSGVELSGSRNWSSHPIFVKKAYLRGQSVFYLQFNLITTFKYWNVYYISVCYYSWPGPYECAR